MRGNIIVVMLRSGKELKDHESPINQAPNSEIENKVLEPTNSPIPFPNRTQSRKQVEAYLEKEIMDTFRRAEVKILY